MMRHSACSSRLFWSRKRQLLYPRSVRAAAERRQHEERHLLTVLLDRGLDAAAEREHPGLAQDREVLDRLVVDHLEAERVVRVVVVVQRHAVEAAAAGVAGRRAPVEADRALRVKVGDLGAESRAGRPACRPFSTDGDVPLAGLLRPLRELDAAAQHQDSCASERA